MTRRHPDRMPDWAFRGMAWWFRIVDRVSPPNDRLSKFGIREGSTVVDYGCGPGRHLEEASRRVGPAGRVYAVDIHDLAIEEVRKTVRDKRLANVTPILARGYSADLPDGVADLVYALDMFHGIADPAAFLAEVRRIADDGGALILEDGHQSRTRTKEKLAFSPHWRIDGERKDFLRCVPRGKGHAAPSPSSGTG